LTSENRQKTDESAAIGQLTANRFSCGANKNLGDVAASCDAPVEPMLNRTGRTNLEKPGGHGVGT
jgi:hypothetical protein